MTGLLAGADNVTGNRAAAPLPAVAVALPIPSDGSVRSLRALIDRLDDATIEVDGLSVHTPDLDDVFFALTGQPKEKEAL